MIQILQEKSKMQPYRYTRVSVIYVLTLFSKNIIVKVLSISILLGAQFYNLYLINSALDIPTSQLHDR